MSNKYDKEEYRNTIYKKTYHPNITREMAILLENARNMGVKDFFKKAKKREATPAEETFFNSFKKITLDKNVNIDQIINILVLFTKEDNINYHKFITKFKYIIENNIFNIKDLVKYLRGEGEKELIDCDGVNPSLYMNLKDPFKKFLNPLKFENEQEQKLNGYINACKLDIPNHLNTLLPELESRIILNEEERKLLFKIYNKETLNKATHTKVDANTKRQILYSIVVKKIVPVFTCYIETELCTDYLRKKNIDTRQQKVFLIILFIRNFLTDEEKKLLLDNNILSKEEIVDMQLELKAAKQELAESQKLQTLY